MKNNINTKPTFLFGCDIDGWTKGTTIDEQRRSAETLKRHIKEIIKKIKKEHKFKKLKSTLHIIDTGDGAIIAFFSLELYEAPLKLAAYLKSKEKKLPNLKIALHFGTVQFSKDANGRTTLVGDGISDTERLISMSKSWQIIASSSYADNIKNINSELRNLFSFSPESRKDKHRKSYSIYYTSGNYRGINLDPIKKIIKENNKKMNWLTFQSSIIELKEQIWDIERFRPQVVIGINQGGAVMGGLFYYYCRNFRFTTLWTYEDWKVYPNQKQKKELIYILKQLTKSVEGSLNILLVDDSFKSGNSMEIARILVKEAVKESKIISHIKTAVIVYKEELRKQKNKKPDYFVYQDYTHFPYARV